MDCSPPGSSVHGILKPRILEWVAISSSWGSSWPRNCTCIPCIGRQILYHCATRETLQIWTCYTQPFSHVQLFATPCTIVRLLCPQDFPGKNTEWLAISYSRVSSWPKDRTCISYKSSALAGRFFTTAPLRWFKNLSWKQSIGYQLLLVSLGRLPEGYKSK